MAMQKLYYRIVWENYPSNKTPVNEQNLNRIDVAADGMDNRIISLDTTKFDKTEAQQLVKYIAYDEDTGIFTITHYNGASYTIDTLLEKLAVNFDYDYRTQRLIITLSDGTIKYVDLSALITQYEFLDSDTCAFELKPDGKVTVKVKEGSIEEKHLRPDYLADIRVESAKAQQSAVQAASSATTASIMAFAAKESEKAAKNSQVESKKSEQTAAASATSANTSKEAAATSAANAGASAAAAKTSEDNAKASETNAKASETKSVEMADMSESYAVGTNGRVRENDATDNSKYYSEQSQNSASMSQIYYEKTKETGDNAVDMINGAIDNINKNVPKFLINPKDGKLYHSKSRFTFIVNRVTGNLEWGLTV